MSKNLLRYGGVCAVMWASTAIWPAAAQVVTGELGSPSATTTAEGSQLPMPDPKFGGVIKETLDGSKVWWPPRLAPPMGAPNVLLILTDDQGYGVSGTFGGVIPTPTLDSLAATGVRYTEMSSTALCSPSRAALITGRNHHSVGFGVITELSTGFPGYNSIIGPESSTIGRILKDNGYATSWFGKNHNTPAFQYTLAGPFDQWPSGMGFDYFYGFMGGETDQWTPYLFENNRQIFPFVGHEGKYNLTTDMADKAVEYLKGMKAADPNSPWFLYYATGGSHSPHQPTQEWIDKFHGKFDMGWNAMRDQIFANQKKLGVIPANTDLTAWPKDLPTWDSLSADEKKLYARQAEVFAAYTAYTDHEIGRVVQQVKDMGQFDNTLIIYVDGDNGTSPEGTLQGTPNQWRAYNGILDVPIAESMKSYDAWGSPSTYPHMAVAWSWAFDTPFQFTKQVASHFGGTRQGTVISWPNVIKDAGGIRNQFHHFIDIVPTILDAVGIKQPDTVDGIKQKPMEGVSMAYTFDKKNTDAPSTRTTQYFELISNRGIYHDGWYANTTPPVGPWVLNSVIPAPTEYKWELYDLTKDYSQAHDLAASNPEKLKEMQALWDTEAAKYQVLPLDNRSFARAISPRPSATAGVTDFSYNGVNPGVDTANAPNTLGRSYTMTADVEVPEGGGNGMLATVGGRFGGWGFYILNGKPIFDYNMLTLAHYRWVAPDALTPGKHTIVFDYTYDGPGVAKGGSGTLSVDGKVVATGKQANSISFLEVSDETFDVGVDLRTEINADDYKVPFAFDGTIDKLAVKLGPTQFLSEAEMKAMEAAKAKAD